MIDHKQSVAEHRLEAERQADLAGKRHARRVGRAILRDVFAMTEEDGEDAANEFFSPTIIQTRGRISGVQERFLYLTEEIVAEGRKHD